MTPAEMHKRISIWKSIVRCVGYGMLWQVSASASIVLFVSELLGLAEEIWGA